MRTERLTFHYRAAGGSWGCAGIRHGNREVGWGEIGAERGRVVGCRLSVAGCRLPVAGCRLSVAGCRLSVAGCRLSVFRSQSHWLSSRLRTSVRMEGPASGTGWKSLPRPLTATPSTPAGQGSPPAVGMTTSKTCDDVFCAGAESELCIRARLQSCRGCVLSGREPLQGRHVCRRASARHS